jgi:hypothetical protein
MNTLKFLFVSFCFFFTNSNFGQTINFIPNWEVGDVKKYAFEVNMIEYENDNLKSDKLHLRDLQITVLSETDKNYTLEIIYNNEVLSKTKELISDIDDIFIKYKYLKMIIRVDKKSGYLTHLNWQESKLFMNESLNEIKTYLEENDFSDYDSFFYFEIDNLIESKSYFEEYVNHSFGFLTSCFHKKIKLNEVTLTQSKEKNFLGLGENTHAAIQTTTKIILKDSTNCIYEISKKSLYDCSNFFEKLRVNFNKNRNGENLEKFEAWINSLKIYYSTEEFFSFNSKTFWVESYQFTSTFEESNFSGEGLNTNYINKVKVSLK